MSPGEEFHTVRLPKGWTPAKILRFADAVNAIGQAQRLGDEVRALRRERRALRAALRTLRDDPVHAEMTGVARKALAPKARRAGKRGTR